MGYYDASGYITGLDRFDHVSTKQALGGRSAAYRSQKSQMQKLMELKLMSTSIVARKRHQSQTKVRGVKLNV